jgi:hypothetical protein
VGEAELAVRTLIPYPIPHSPSPDPQPLYNTGVKDGCVEDRGTPSRGPSTLIRGGSRDNLDLGLVGSSIRIKPYQGHSPRQAP